MVAIGQGGNVGDVNGPAARQLHVQGPATQLGVGTATWNLIHHIDAAIAGYELPDRRPWQHPRGHGSVLLAGVEHAGIERAKRGGQPFQIGRIRSRNEIGVVGGSHMPVGLHRKPTNQHVFDSMLGQG